MTTEILECGHRPTPDSGIGTGYATDRDGRRMCYGCADSAQAAEMSTTPAGGRFLAYLSSDGRNVTTWSGGVLARVTRHTSNARQTFVRAVDASGGQWAGIGPAESGTYVSLRRVRGAR